MTRARVLWFSAFCVLAYDLWIGAKCLDILWPILWGGIKP